MEHLTASNYTNASLSVCRNGTFNPQCGGCISREPWLDFIAALNTWFAVTVPLWLLGTGLDLLLCLSIFTDRQMLTNKASSMVLLGNLVFIETLMTSVYMAIYVFMTWTGGRYRNLNISCGVVHFAFIWTISTSHWSSLFLAASRMLASMAPVTFRKYGSMRANVMAITSAWLIGFVCTVPILFGVGSYNDRVPPWYACGAVIVSGVKYTVLLSVGNFLPVLLTLGIYVALLRRTQVLVTSDQASVAAGVSSQRRLLSVRMLAVGALVSWICYFVQPASGAVLPCFVKRYPVVKLWSVTLFFCGYVFNPVSWFNMLVKFCNLVCGYLDWNGSFKRYFINPESDRMRRWLFMKSQSWISSCRVENRKCTAS